MLRVSPRRVVLSLVLIGAVSLFLFSLLPALKFLLEAVLRSFKRQRSYTDIELDMPSLIPRCPIYTFHDTDTTSSTDELEVIAVWRKAFWAAGFRPIVLSTQDSQKHPKYANVLEKVKDEKPPTLLLKWLAWSVVGGGILTDWTVIPFMYEMKNPSLYLLQSCTFDALAIQRYENFGESILMGANGPVANFLERLLAVEDFNSLDLLTFGGDDFQVLATPSDLAYYSPDIIVSRYENMELRQLAVLINAHLHQAMLLAFPEKILVVNPFFEISKILVFPALRIARQLARCPSSPLKSSQSPLHQYDTPCEVRKHPVAYAQGITNSTKSIQLLTVAHPLTYLWLKQKRAKVQPSFVRRHTDRDSWMVATTRDISPAGVGAEKRLTILKRALISQSVAILAATWEESWDENDVSGVLGFSLPPISFEDEIIDGEGTRKYADNVTLLSEAKKTVLGLDAESLRQRAFVEAWNLADTGMWRFVQLIVKNANDERRAWALGK